MEQCERSAGLLYMMPMVSVVVVNYNGQKFLPGCLTSLAEQTVRDFEVIVIDNGSVDGSEDAVQTHFPGAKLFRLSTNQGYPAALNYGIKESKGEFILALNNDTTLNPGFMEALLSSTFVDKSVGMWAVKMILPDGRINSTGICISRSGAAWDRGMFQPDTGQFDQADEVFGPCGGAALYRREMLEEIGYFDEDFFLYMEDVDVAFRGRLAGWRCAYVPKAVVIHHHSGTAGYGSDLAVYYGNRNILWYWFKDLPAGLLIVYLPWLLGRTFGVICYYGVRGQGRVALHSKIDGIAGLGRMINKRRFIIRKVGYHDLSRFIRTWYARKAV
ncbi:MAG: glycosyltransferase [Methanoregulaceae archaeon]|nr:glycosyltransferase [Methanoregulaceae archaeon]